MRGRVLAWSGSAVHSGAEAVFADICEGLSAKGVYVTAAAPLADEVLHGRLVRAGIPVVDAPVQPGGMGAVHLWNPLLLRRVREVVRVGGSDALFVNLPSGELGAAPAIVAGGRPTVGLLHVHQRLDRLPFRLGGLRTRLAVPALRRFDRVLCVAPGVEADVAREWGLARDAVGWAPLPFPTIPSDLPSRDEARVALGFAATDRVVVLVGRLSIKQKGHDVFLDAVAQLAPSVPELKVTLVGSGPDEAAIAALIGERGLEHVVELKGPVRPAALAMRAADAIAIPSRFEGLPLVALEALALGLRGVASSIDGLQSVWPQRWLVPPGDSGELAGRLHEVLLLPADKADAVLAAALLHAHELTTADPAAAVLAALDSARGQARA